ncbi:hypothetical protein OS493_035069 [Desmophyllum pertusum]|uniref:Uncharacterized protein n=1 Tax=Desmophyllum pertusum TaxID=174260 RepID=A0A9W9ZJD6_9CNID|nr:hypothetical protein OS493_035069 [Desmophyllum pertusum]
MRIEFASFIQEIARQRNDPYLSMEGPEKKNTNPVKTHIKPSIKPNDDPLFGQGMTASRTEVSDPDSKDSATQDPAKWCVVHKLTHPLNKCRVSNRKKNSAHSTWDLLSLHRLN